MVRRGYIERLPKFVALGDPVLRHQKAIRAGLRAVVYNQRLEVIR